MSPQKGLSADTYSEGLQVIHGDLVAEEVKESILEHAAVAVAVKELVNRLLGQYWCRSELTRERSGHG